jgi:hypothetical protein
MTMEDLNEYIVQREFFGCQNRQRWKIILTSQRTGKCREVHGLRRGDANRLKNNVRIGLEAGNTR